MSVLVYIESPKGQIKKTGNEVAYYGAKVAESLGTNCIAVVIGKAENVGNLGKFGVSKVLHVNADQEIEFDSQALTSVITQVASENGANTVILANTANGKSLTGRLAIKMNAGNVSGVNSLPDTSNGFVVSKSVYSGKAVANYNITTSNKVISLMGNTLQIQEVGQAVSPENITVTLPATKLKVIERKTSEGIVPLPEAELVVSAGRGMKGPENWGIIEELASALGATTACSRPVADAHWRPHHEHVGQTGVAIRPNLYIAAGISGAIQHLAGVNNSKVIVVINKDPEAPFFKAADYGVVGDLFEVVPRLTAAIKKYKQA
ncbi:MAG TPA: electron transfer flavoprotein subunit alpha/FixB family protein [Saprospiraceae bacterium]|nr:electron transfer flavoprotein subunit alpha/FixB family protein [Saprospiraceae bacterium]